MIRQIPEKSLLANDSLPFPRNTGSEYRDTVLEEAIESLLSDIEQVFKDSAGRYEATAKTKPTKKQKSAA